MEYQKYWMEEKEYESKLKGSPQNFDDRVRTYC